MSTEPKTRKHKSSKKSSHERNRTSKDSPPPTSHSHHRDDDDVESQSLRTRGASAPASSSESSLATWFAAATQSGKEHIEKLKVSLNSLVSTTRERSRGDANFKLKMQIAALAFVTLFVISAQMYRVSRHRFGSAGSRGPSSGVSQVAGGSSGSSVSIKESGVILESEMKTKLQYEAQELNLDAILKGTDLLSVRRRYGTRQENEKAQQEIKRNIDKKCQRFPATIRRDNPSVKKYYMPHKVFDLPVLQRSLKRLGYELTEDIKEATQVLKGVPRILFKQLKEGSQYYDMVASLGRIGSKKKTQLATLRAHVKKFGCTFESLNVQPISYDMNRVSDCKAFFDTHEDTGRMIVFKSCKNGEGSKGAGISVTDDLSEYRAEWSKCEANAFNYVAQHYIEKPMLIKNRKFDMRVYLLVAATQPYIVFFNPGYIRRSLAEYKASSTEKNDVLTNYHVQVTRSDFKPEDALWSFQQFMDYLKSENLCKACGDVEMQLAKIARLVFDAGRGYYVPHPGSFQLAGLDFMVDANIRPQFIEGNVSPGLGSHDLKWKKELMDDLLTMMYEQTVLIHERPEDFTMVPGDRIYGPHGNYWQLLVHETLETCDPKKWSFDPCKELTTPWKTWL